MFMIHHMLIFHLEINIWEDIKNKPIINTWNCVQVLKDISIYICILKIISSNYENSIAQNF